MAISYVAWVVEHSKKLSGVHRHARDQWLRASQSFPLNIAEKNGKTAEADRSRYFEIARGSVLECAEIQDVLVVGKALEENKSGERKVELDRIAAMLSRLEKRGYSVQEETAGYGVDFDPDSDSLRHLRYAPSIPTKKPQQDAAANSASLRRRAHRYCHTFSNLKFEH